MRFFEFTLSDLDKKISADLEEIKDAVSQDPYLTKKVNDELNRIIELAKSYAKDEQNKEVENPNNDIDDKVSEDAVSAITKSIEEFKQIAKTLDPNSRKLIEKEIKKLKEQITVATDPDTVFDKISKEFKDLLDKRSDINPSVREVFIKELFDYIRINRQTELVKQFLNDCVNGNGPIDMPSIVANEGSGNLVEKNNPYYNILLKLAKTNPGSGNAASGQGEYMLVLAGKNTKKIIPGDIAVVVSGKEEKIEVKSSDLKGKSSYTDFVLSSDKLPVTQAKSYFVNEINQILGRQAIGSGTSTTGGISALNDKTLKKLNPIFQEVNSKKIGEMQRIIKGLWKIVYPNSKLNSYIEEVGNAVNSDGTIELEKLYAPTAVLSAAAYKISNSHDALLMLNIPDLSYITVRNPDKMSSLFQQGALELGMTSIFDFRSNPGAPTFIKKFRNSGES
jgi:hypothetical protein